MNKKYLQAALIFALTCFVIYMAGAFAAATFDINKWDAFGRGVVAFTSVIFGGMLASFCLYPD